MGLLLAVMDQPKSKQRKGKFSDNEVDILVHEVTANLNVIQGRNSTPTQKNAIWTEITKKINAISSTRRQVEDVKKRWQDIKRRTKEKVAFNRSQARKTGAGPPEVQELTMFEEVVQQTLAAEQVEGVEGIDTAETTLENEGKSD